jgi:serine/threonine protein kinase
VGGRYEVKELLGQGGMGVVFLANERALDRPVAIKVLPLDLSHDEKFVQRFEHEARTSAKLDHPNIIPIYAVESDGDLHYFVMKFVAGRALDEILEAGPMPVDAAQRILWEAACSLGHAHTRGIVHRDIKPANVMIDDAGRTMLADFGISKALETASQFTATGQVIGTPHYMSPEQAKGHDVDGRSDQYSLAVVGYRMLAGRLPFDDDSVHTIIYKHIFEPPPDLQGLRRDAPGYLIHALHKALAKDPNDRYATMEEFATAVLPSHPVTADTSSSASLLSSGGSLGAATEITAAPPPRKRRKGMRTLLTLITIGAAAGGTWWVMYGSESLSGGAEPQIQAAAAGLDDSVGGAITPPESTVTRDTTTQPAPQQEEEQAPSDPPRGEQTPAGQNRQPQRPVQQPAAPQVGWVTVDARPYGTVWINGLESGDTPLVRHELRPGQYVIEIRREGFGTSVDTVRVTAGNTVRRSYTLIREQS